MYSTDDEYFDSDEFRDMLATYEEAVSQGQPVFLDADELAWLNDYNLHVYETLAPHLSDADREWLMVKCRGLG